MGFNRKNLARIHEEYEHKYRIAEDAADARKKQLWAECPTLEEIDRELSRTGLEIMRAAIDAKPLDPIQKRNESLLARRKELLLAAGYPENYTDPVYSCPECRDSGYIDCRMCSCMRKRLIEAAYESSGIASLMRTQSFDNFRLDYYDENPKVYEMMKCNFAKLRDYAEAFTLGEDGRAPSPSLTLSGGPGLGKTHLTTAVAKTVIDLGYDAVYVSAIDLFADFDAERFRQRDGGADVDRYYDCDLLLLDDLGAEAINQLTISNLYHLLNVRINRSLPTIISTNFDSKKIQTVYGDRIASRLFGEFRPLLFAGTDIRMLRMKGKKK